MKARIWSSWGIVTWGWLCMLFTVGAFALEPYDPDTPRFLLSTFRNAAQTRLYLAGSFDGRAYTLLGGGAHVYETVDGTQIRDPSIVRYRGTWYICHTSGTSLGNAPFFRILASQDLLSWSHIKDVSMASIPNTRYTWAPEWFINSEGGLHVLVSTSYWGTYEHVIHEIHPLDGGNPAGYWSDPQRLWGPAFPEIEPWTDAQGIPVNGQRVGAYDPFLLKIGDVYHLWYFNRGTSSLAHATSPSMHGPYTADATSNLYKTGYWKEGETMLHLSGTCWRFTYADAITSTLYYIESSDNWATWTAPAPIVSPPGITFNHGTVIYNPHAPAFETEIVSSPNGQVILTFPSLAENGYQLQWSLNLTDWFNEGEPFQGDGHPIQIETEIGTEQKIFYRIKWLPLW